MKKTNTKSTNTETGMTSRYKSLLLLISVVTTNLGYYVPPAGNTTTVSCNVPPSDLSTKFGTIIAELHTELNMSLPFYVGQTIDLKVHLDNGSTLLLTQICEMDSNDLLLTGFNDYFTINRTVSRVKSIILNYDMINEGSAEQTTPFTFWEEQDKSTTQWPLFTTPYWVYNNPTTPLNRELSSTVKPLHTTPKSKQTTAVVEVDVQGIISIQANGEEITDEMKRNMGYDAPDPPDSYTPPYSTARYQSAVKGFISRRVGRDVSQIKLPLDTSTVTKLRVGLDLIRRRIHKLDTTMKELMFLFKVAMVIEVGTPSKNCIQEPLSIERTLRCWAKHYKAVSASPNFYMLLTIFGDIIDKETKMRVETKEYDYLKTLIKSSNI
ncbi:MAG: hypothetical protein QKV30_gp3 [Apis rhabdovirus 3]|uniref:Uncharacterized protein n=1 Tax=Apis rhabdovirus 3 TaxID=2873557 RepID=A0A8K1J8W3_9RHAB|nr:MAG: hypothetical protein QKV30_gp3 [Apis rhabdovirus 3]UCR92528.1 MAG: hypothetical protein [Apis rhabdovirus 3]